MLPVSTPLLLVLLLAAPALPSPTPSDQPQVRGQSSPRQDSIKVSVSQGCVTQEDGSDRSGGKELDLDPGSPLVLTHRITLVPSSGSKSRLCGCEADFAALRERLEHLEREVSTLREKCGEADGGCCTSKESKGPGCSIQGDEDECPNGCSDQGRCSGGACVCFPGFHGADCGQSNCPGNCSGRGRCVDGGCVCRARFTGPDCSRCDGGLAGPNCDTVMSGVLQLSASDITETSVLLLWTPPGLQYETYYVTFSSQKQGDQQISAQVDGGLTTYSQTGLAAGQDYTASIAGEIAGRRGAESSVTFMTLTSGPTNLRVVKTTSTSAVVQWEQSQGEIDRYRVMVTANDGAGGTQELTVPAGQNSAHIQQLEAGRLYDVVLVAEKGASRSKPATSQVTPGKTLPRVTMAALELTPRQDLHPSDEVQVFDQQGRREEVKVGGLSGLNNKDSATSQVITGTKPLPSKGMGRNGTIPKVPERSSLYKKPNVSGSFRLNTTRVLSRWRQFGPVGQKKKAPVGPLNLKPHVPAIGNRTIALTLRDPGVNVLTPEANSDTNRQSSSEEPTTDAGIKEQTDVGRADQGNNTEPTGTGQSQEKKCVNKLKVKPFRLPDRGTGSGCKGHGTLLVAKTTGSDQGYPKTDDLKPSSSETHVNYSPDPLLKLLTDTFDNLNITTFSVHLSKPSNLSVNAETATRQILRGLRPLAASSSASHLSSSARPLSSSSSLSSPSSSAAAPSPPHSPSSSPSSSLSSSDRSGSIGSNEPNVDNGKSASHVTSPEDGKLQPSGTLFQRTLVKHGYVRRPRPNFGSHQNKTHLNLGVPPPKRETEMRYTSTIQLPSSPFSSASAESSVAVEAPVRDMSGDKDGATAMETSPRVEQNQTMAPTERERIPVRRLSPKGRYLLRHPILGALQNLTRPNLRQLPPPSRPINPASDARIDQVSSAVFLATSSSPVSKKSFPTEGKGPIVAEKDDRVGTTSMPTEFNQTIRRIGMPSSHRPTHRVGYLRQLYAGRFQNNTRTNLQQPQRPNKAPIRKLFPNKKTNGGTNVGGQVVQLDENQSGGQNAPLPSPIRPPGERGTAGVIPHSLMDHQNITVRPQMNKLQGWDNAPNQTNQLGVARIRTSDSSPDTHKDKANAGTITGATRQGGPKLHPLTTAQRHSQTGRHRSGETKTDTSKGLFKSKPGQTKEVDLTDDYSSGEKREPLDHVGVTNRTSDGFTLTWDSPEKKYKNFVVTSRDAGKGEEAYEEEGGVVKEAKHHQTKGTKSEKEDIVSESVSQQRPKIPTRTEVKPVPEPDQTWKNLLPGSARSFRFEHLPPQTEYTVTLLGSGPGLLSRLHRLVISTGPEPPTNIVFSEVTENSLTVSWTKPKTPVSGFKVTYTQTEEDEPVSVLVDPDHSSLDLTKLSPGSSYEVSVISVLGLDESDPIRDQTATLPDPPTDLQASNVTDTTALLLWRPALAGVDKYVIVYGAGTDSEVKILVSGNAAEQLLSGLEASSTYRVTVSSQRGSKQSAGASTHFTTAGDSGGRDDPRDLRADDITPRTAVLSWKPPSNLVDGYRLTYQSEGLALKEVMVDASATQYNLTRLHPGSKYSVQLQAEGGGRYSAAISTDFTTGTLRFPFPTDCSQELLNGIRMSGEAEVFPQGKLGTPMEVYCDMETEGGGWTVFQRRKDGSVDFFRGWKDYTKGFGALSGEFWLGLESIYNLTAMTRMSLRVDLRDKDGAAFAEYSTFELVKRNYKLIVSGYSGTAGDSLSYHSQRIFSTKDRDLAPFITRCAMSYRGGWWYKNCHEANLNGAYGTNLNQQGVIWTTWRGTEFSVPFTEMKMRPAVFSPPTMN